MVLPRVSPCAVFESAGSHRETETGVEEGSVGEGDDPRDRTPEC